MQSNKNKYRAAFVFLWFFAILMLFNCYIHIPQPATDALQLKLRTERTMGEYFRLRADDYEVVRSVETTAIGDSVFYHHTTIIHYYTTYEVLVNGDFTMYVRATEKENDALAAGTPVDLYGMVNEYNGAWCLNDNGTETEVTRSAGAIVSGMMGLSTVALIVWMKHRAKKQAEASAALAFGDAGEYRDSAQDS